MAVGDSINGVFAAASGQYQPAAGVSVMLTFLSKPGYTIVGGTSYDIWQAGSASVAIIAEGTSAGTPAVQEARIAINNTNFLKWNYSGTGQINSGFYCGVQIA